MCDLMTLNDSHPLLAGEVGLLGVKEEGSRASSNKTLEKTVNS